MSELERVRASLHAALDEALDREAAELGLTSPPVDRRRDLAAELVPERRQSFRPRRPTSLQEAQNAQRELVELVLEHLSEREARAWFSFLIETAARHALRAGEGRSP